MGIVGRGVNKDGFHRQEICALLSAVWPDMPWKCMRGPADESWFPLRHHI